jgi:GNAT superfamily N-acetyltransferase
VRIQFFEPRYFQSFADAMHELDQHYFGQAGASREAVSASLERGLLGANSGVKVVLAVDEGEVAGLATVSLLFPAPELRGQLFMKDLFVRQNWRGHGVGEQIMQFLAVYAVNLNCVRFDWTTENTNSGAMAFYARLGAEHIRRKVYYRLTGPALEALAKGASESRPESDARLKSNVKPHMNLRGGVPADIPSLDTIAFAAKAHWGYAPEQLQAWRDDLLVSEKSLTARPVCVAEENGHPIGFVQVATDTEPWELWAMWVHPAHMGKGVGKKLLAWAKHFAASAGQAELAIDSDPNAAGFYRACGASHVGSVAAPIASNPGRVRPQLRLRTLER